MRYVLMTKYGNANALLPRLQEEGKTAVLLPLRKSDMYKGIIKHVNSLKLDDVILFDMVGNGAKSLRQRVFGASRWSDEIELYREKGIMLAYKLGFSVPKSHIVKTIEEGIDIIRKNPIRWVLKPNKNMALDLTYISNSPEEMISILKNYMPNRISGDYILQEYIEGDELSAEAWWNGKEFQLHNCTIEDKRFMVGGLGENVGSSINTVWKDNPLNEQFNKLAEILTKDKIDYRGPIDFNCIWSGGKPYFLEATCRIGFDAIFCLLELTRQPLHEIIDACLNGGEIKSLRDRYGSSIRISVKPYPNLKGLEKAKGLPVDIKKKDGIWLNDILFKDEYLCAGDDGNICVVTGYGKTIKESWDVVYKRVKNITIPDPQYRTDGSEITRRRFNSLKRHRII